MPRRIALIFILILPYFFIYCYASPVFDPICNPASEFDAKLPAPITNCQVDSFFQLLQSLLFVSLPRDSSTPGIELTQSGGTTNVTEAGGTDTYTIVLMSTPSSAVFIEASGGSQLLVNGLSTATLSFDTNCPGSNCWSTIQTLTVSAVNDDLEEGIHTQSISHTVSSNDTGYNLFAVPQITANIQDNDSAGVTITESGGTTSVTEAGGTDTYTVVLTSQPTNTVTITVTADAQTRVNSGATATLTFTTGNWNTTQTVTVGAVNDLIAEGTHNGTITHSSSSSDTNYNAIAIVSVTASIADNDSAGVTIAESGGSTSVTEAGGTDTYTVVLTSQPTNTVTVTVTADAQIRVNSGATATLTFTTGNWNTTQTVTVSAVDDATTEGNHSGTISHSATSSDTTYNGISISSLTVSIVENDFLSSSVPANNAINVAPCTGIPCRGSIVLRFDQSMNASLTPTFVTELANSNTTYVATSNTNTAFTWSTTTFANDTLTINIGWYWFPETSKLRYTLGNLQSLAGVSSDSIQQIFTTTGSGQVFPVKDTGQTSCYTTSSTATTICTSATFPGQDGFYVNIPTARSFTGPTPHGTFGTNFTTLDNVTSLRFASCSVGQSGAGCTGSATAMTFETGVNACSDLNIQNSGSGYWGLTNWRLPTQNELATLPNYGVTGPAIDTISFPSTFSGAYWASGAYQNFFRAYGVNFIGGTINDGAWDVKSNTNYVRCVSAPTTVTTASYTDNNDGTISDNNTGLRWQKCSNGQTNDSACSGTALTTTWKNQLLYCSSLVLGVHANASNWRLPSAMELTSILDVSSAINSTYFPNSAVGSYVSSTSHSFSGGRHNVFHRNNVSMPLNPKTLSSYAARCVSTGP